MAPCGRASVTSNIFRVVVTDFNGFDLENDPQGILDNKQKHQVFAQKGYSHLNLYVRLLVFLQQSESTDEGLHYSGGNCSEVRCATERVQISSRGQL